MLMKKLLSLVTLFCVVFLITGTAIAAEEKLVVYTARVEKLNTIIIKGFEKKYNIKVESVTGGSGEILKRVQAEVESGNVHADIHWAADETMLSNNASLFQVYVSKENQSMMPNFRNNGKNVFNMAFAEPNVLIVNTNLLAKLGVTVNSYADLINPKLKGQIIMGDPANSSSAFQCLIGMLYGMGKTNDPMSDQAWQYIDKLLANMAGKQANSSSQIYKGVAAGEYAVGLSFEDPCVELEATGEYPVKVVYPKEGVIFPAQSVQIVKGAPNLKNAQLFVDYMLSQEGQSNVAREMNLRPLRAGVAVNKNMIPTEKIKLFDNYTAAYIAKNKPLILSTFIKHIEMSMD